MDRFLVTAATLIAASAAAYSSASHAQASSDEPGVRAVISQFQAALKAKDEAGIVKLFASNDAPITGSASQKAFEFVRSTKKADAPKVMDSTSGKFAASMAGMKGTAEETFSNIKIDSDDAVAAVSFDFVFLMDGKPANVGKEAWLLVKTEQGWRISSIVYSINFPGKG